MTPNEGITAPSFEGLSKLPPRERFSAAVNDPRLAVRAVFYTNFGLPLEFTRFGISTPDQIERYERERRSLGEGDFVASVKRHEMDGYLNETQRAILEAIRGKHSELTHRIASLSDIFRDRAGVVMRTVRKFLGLSRETEIPEETHAAVFDLLDQVNRIWQDLEPAVFRNAMGQGREVTMEMVEMRFDQLTRVIQAKEAELQALKEDLLRRK